MAFLYHASPSHNRASIQRYGMRAHEDGRQLWVRTAELLNPRGNYGYEDLGGARAFAEGALYHRLGYEIVDIWKMDVSGLEVLFDPEIRDIQHNHHTVIPKWVHEAIKKGKTPPRWYVPALVEAGRLELAETIDWIAQTQPTYASKRMRNVSFKVASAKNLPVWPHD